MRREPNLWLPCKGVQVAAELDLPAETDFARVPALQRLLVLEGVQNPGNLVRQQLVLSLPSRVHILLPWT